MKKSDFIKMAKFAEFLDQQQADSYMLYDELAYPGNDDQYSWVPVKEVEKLLSEDELRELTALVLKYSEALSAVYAKINTALEASSIDQVKRSKAKG
jgi:hypothetical protein